VAKTGKPVIVSTGVSTMEEIMESVEVLKKSGCKEIILLKCTSTYPASAENTNLLTIPDMKQKYNCTIGLSDHTMGTGVSVAAVALGACVIEKHFTLRRADGGVDSAFSLEPEELKSLVIETERAFLAMGKIQYNVQNAERNSLQYKRSIYVSKDLQPGDVLTEENIRIIRPALGIEPKHWDDVLGKKVNTNIKSGTPLNWDLISK
jgi:sialic acid synthase SpsE